MWQVFSRHLGRSKGRDFKAAALIDLSTVADIEISNPPWVKFQSAGWVNFPSAPTHLPEADWEDLQTLVENADTSLLQFECFTLPLSDAIGFKIFSTPWTDDHLGKYWGYDLQSLQALQAEEGFSDETIRLLTLAAQADVRFLVIDPNSNVLNGLPLFGC